MESGCVTFVGASTSYKYNLLSYLIYNQQPLYGVVGII